MKCNVGKTDQMVRLVLGVILLGAAFFSGVEGTLKYILIVAGIIALGTGLLKFCALYTLLGMSTCDTEEKSEKQ